jgi:hypothetical protein
MCKQWKDQFAGFETNIRTLIYRRSDPSVYIKFLGSSAFFAPLHLPDSDGFKSSFVCTMMRADSVSFFEEFFSGIDSHTLTEKQNLEIVC